MASGRGNENRGQGRPDNKGQQQSFGNLDQLRKSGRLCLNTVSRHHVGVNSRWTLVCLGYVPLLSLANRQFSIARLDGDVTKPLVLVRKSWMRSCTHSVVDG